MELKVGIGKSVITPFLEQPMAGYYYPRAAEGVHDDLYAKAVVLDDGREQVVLVACDAINMSRSVVEAARERIRRHLGIPPAGILISATHSHTGPEFTADYLEALERRIADAVVTAHGRKQPARLWLATEHVASLPHYRRYLMKDGTVVTNPGFLNSDVLLPMGDIDPRLPVLYAENAQGEPLLTWANYSMHPDTVGGTWISADYPYFLGRAIERLKGPDMLTVFTIGAAGNVNHWDVRRPGPQRGLDEARRLGETLGAAVSQAYTHLEPLAPSSLRAISTTIRVPLRKVTWEEVEEARRILAVPPPPNIDFTLDRVHATRVVSIADHGSETLVAELQVLAVGSVAFVGIPGELFVELGREIQMRSPFSSTIIVGLANENIGYLPTRTAYDEGAYEPTSSRMMPGAGEQIVAAVVDLLQQLSAKMSLPTPEVEEIA